MSVEDAADIGLVSELRHKLKMDDNTTWGILVVGGEQSSDATKVGLASSSYPLYNGIGLWDRLVVKV